MSKRKPRNNGMLGLGEGLRVKGEDKDGGVVWGGGLLVISILTINIVVVIFSVFRYFFILSQSHGY